MVGTATKRGPVNVDESNGREMGFLHGSVDLPMFYFLAILQLAGAPTATKRHISLVAS